MPSCLALALLVLRSFSWVLNKPALHSAGPACLCAVNPSYNNFFSRQDKSIVLGPFRVTWCLFIPQMLQNVSRGRGRPRTPLLDRLRVMVWSHHVLSRSGLWSVQEFERVHLRGGDQSYRLASGLWPRYLRGEAVPADCTESEKSTVIGFFDALFPGTARIFRHPLWDLLDVWRLMGPTEIRELLCDLDLRVSAPYMYHAHYEGRAKEQWKFWRHRLHTQASVEYFRQLSGLDALAMCLVELRLTYLGQQLNDFGRAVWLTRSHTTKLSSSEPFCSHRNLKSALLVMEAICLSFAGAFIGRLPDSLSAAFEDDQGAVVECELIFIDDGSQAFDWKLLSADLTYERDDWGTVKVGDYEGHLEWINPLERWGKEFEARLRSHEEMLSPRSKSVLKEWISSCFERHPEW